MYIYIYTNRVRLVEGQWGLNSCQPEHMQAKDFQRSVEIAKEEAKKTDVEAQRARKEVTSRIARVSEELRDAERHLHFITELRAQEFARLGEVEQQKRELLEVHRKGAVEHERMKCQLDALGSGQGPAELFDLPKSQRSSQFLTLQGPELTTSEPEQQRFAPRRPL
ncbi:unnamed protein product [Durusdinium trenchii]|uniref:Uncharacterized protein n=1 Tax=Durusdinium trenchii TaxID=1381693 RepID=A0ABP0JTZ0_9DINO